MTWQALAVLACVFGAFVLGALCAGVRPTREAFPSDTPEETEDTQQRDYEAIQEAWAAYIATIDLCTPEGGHGPRHDAFARYWALCEEYEEVWRDPSEVFPHAPTHGRSSNTAEIREAGIKPCELTWDELCERYYHATRTNAGVPLWAAMEAMHEGKFMPTYRAWCAYLSGIEARNLTAAEPAACNAQYSTDLA